MSNSDKRKWGGLAVLSLALAIIIIDTTLINVSLRTMVKDLDTTVKSLQWVITGYALVLSAFTITGGRLGDLFGRKRLFLIGAITFAIGSLVAATAPNVAQLFVGASIIEGLGAAMMMPATSSLLLSNFHGRERGIAFGVWGGVAGAAASVGPLLGGYLTTYYSWRWGYTVNLFIVAMVLLFSWLINDARETDIKKPTIDFVGVLLSALGLGAIVYGIIESQTYGWFKAKQVSEIFGHTVNLGDYSFVPFVIALGVVLLIMFVMWQAIREYRGLTPLVSLKLFGNSRFMAGATTLAIVAMGQFGAIFALPVFLQAARGLDAFHNGLALLPFSLSVLVAAPLAGAIGSKKIPAKYLIISGLVIDAIGLWLLREAITPTATANDLIFPLIVFGTGFGMAFAQLANLTLSAVSVQQAGEASGVNNTFRQIGATLGNALIGSIVISTLATNLSDGIKNSPKIPDKLKPAIEASANERAQSLGEEKPKEGAVKLPQAITDELTNIQNIATADAVRTAMGYGVAVLGVGVLASLRLPKGAGPAAPSTEKSNPADKPKPKAKPESKTAPVHL
jgi:EmrB/QacA subfamily drug resistance transporter